jgi:hypothetical protein
LLDLGLGGASVRRYPSLDGCGIVRDKVQEQVLEYVPIRPSPTPFRW